MQHVLECMFDNTFEELEGACGYYKLAEAAKEAGHTEIAQLAIASAKEELSHFKWQNDRLMDLNKDAMGDNVLIHKVFARIQERYEEIKTKIDHFSIK